MTRSREHANSQVASPATKQAAQQARVSGLSRRAVLRSLGASLALPFLPSLQAQAGQAGAVGAMAEASGAGVAGGQAAKLAAMAPPKRLACLFFPNGVNVSHWQAAGEGAAMTLSKTLSPLEGLKQHLLIPQGLHHKKAGGGDGHYAKTANWLSGEVVQKTRGRDLRVGESMDQLVARQVGQADPLSSLILATEPTNAGIDLNVGFTQLYGGHISWSSPTTPVPKEVYPRQAFDRLFRRSKTGTPKSVLDAVQADARALSGRLGMGDRQKLDEYMQSVREVERRVEQAEQNVQDRWEPNVPPALQRPNAGLPEHIADHMALMLDLIVLAFQTNQTRVASFMFGNSVSGRDMSFLDGVKGGHHGISHHENNDKNLAMYQTINQFHVQLYADMLTKMASIQEGDDGGTLLDHSMVMFGSGLADGNSHQHKNLPIIVGGGQGAGVASGRAWQVEDNTPLCALHLGLIQRMGVQVDAFGDAEQALVL